MAKSGAFEQERCLPGTYSPGAGAVECIQCEEGRYVSRKRATACDLASGGEYVATRGATKPSKCTAGRFSGSGASFLRALRTRNGERSRRVRVRPGGSGSSHQRESEVRGHSRLEPRAGRIPRQPENRSALASLLNDVIGDLADQPAVVTSIQPALSKDAFSSPTVQRRAARTLFYSRSRRITPASGVRTWQCFSADVGGLQVAV